MSTIAFLGLGQMGAPMAARLLDAGHDLTVWNRTAERAEPLAGKGARVASSPAEAAAGADVVITMLATPEALEEVAFGKDGFASALTPGQTLIEMSTVGPATLRSVASRLPDGVAVVDAPVRGSVTEAAEGKLHVIAGATDKDFERVRPLLELIGDVLHAGGPGTGAAMKLVANAALGISIVALGEALALGESMGLDRPSMLDVLAETPIGPAAASKRDSVLSGRYPPRFKLTLAAKDLRLVEEAARDGGLDLKATRGARASMDEGIERGAGGLDYSAVAATILGDEPRP
jgi:3-hydroxyisobutyrate dehydrogenase-like beta-hydroxyacid dehydrogenase